MSEPAFGVVLLNWNGCNDTIAALESLIAATPRPRHVVLVDNGSTDDSLPRLRAWAAAQAPSWAEASDSSDDTAPADSWLLLITAPQNLGFSAGNNLGLRYLAQRTDCTHYLLLNNDAMIAPDYFARISEGLRAVPDAALTGCTIYRHPNREQVWFGGSYEIPSRALILHRYEPATNSEPHATAFVTGCAMVISRALFDAEGGLPELFDPIYWEDADYSARVRNAGWRVVMMPAAHVYHRVGASGGGERLSPRVAYLQNRNRGFYVRRNYRGADRVLALAYLIATKPTRALAEVLRGRPAVGRAVLNGLVRGLMDPAR